MDLATHMAKYQPVLIELQNETVPEFSGNAIGSGENCWSHSKLNHIRGGGHETQDGKRQHLFFHY